MTFPHWTSAEIVFCILVLACFAAFAFTLAGVHLYVSLPLRRKPAPARAARRASPAKDHIVSA